MELNDRVKEGWRISARGYSGIVQAELDDGAESRWVSGILEMAPREGRLKILDVGTGPGFFAMILAKAGHDLTGIDASPDMLQCARENVAEFGVTAKFQVMDSQQTEFEDNSFDMVISRNVVWTLVRPEDAYRDWLRILKPGGRVLIFDGDMSERRRTPKVKAIEKENRAKYLELYGNPPMSFKDEEFDKARGWKVDMPLYNEPRPEWDVKTLEKLGYKNVSSEYVADRVHDVKRLLLYRTNPMYRVCGEK
ncbi:ubiquinone/menaquinone biosynthesis methyltransferase UbiE [Desulfocucumis palustris]|uniref:Ubiquinone/menaquinone biosynthesis methyltransferase UbiE n=1 Tax=Desulfocucumis palustris TaxID=1898651 RepID=A0A2L2XBQ6_9FIRM|nr:class I SAM-dependent methyltransferase [Desulfocucumis palustris]GBF33123.1 ubiquinone/menaquinone biosynthesis methyltransferase UbiE [Desulfocucumis palustris]